MSQAASDGGQPVLVLAAGHGTRMGGPKAFAHFRDRSFLEHILDRCAETASPITVTVDPAFRERMEAMLSARATPRPGMRLRWALADGAQPMLASVQAGLAAEGFSGGAAAGPRGFFLWPVDAPFLSAPGWRRLHAFAVEEAARGEAARIVKPRSAGRTGHPVWWPAWSVPRILAGAWSDGLQGLLREAGPNRIGAVDLPDEILQDVDTPQELIAVQQRANARRDIVN